MRLSEITLKTLAIRPVTINRKGYAFTMCQTEGLAARKWPITVKDEQTGEFSQGSLADAKRWIEDQLWRKEQGFEVAEKEHLEQGLKELKEGQDDFMKRMMAEGLVTKTEE